MMPTYPQQMVGGAVGSTRHREGLTLQIDDCAAVH